MGTSGKIEWAGPFDHGFSFRAQYQLIALFVWLSGAIFLLHSLKYWHPWRYSDTRAILPILHFLPWLVSLAERRRQKKLSLAGDFDTSCARIFEQSILRLLWVGYIDLAIVEYAFAS